MGAINMTDIFDQMTQSSTPNTTQSNDKIQPNIDNESFYTPQAIKQAAQELIKCGLLDMAQKPKLYQTSITYFSDIQNILEPLDLQLRIDDIRGLAYLVAAGALMEDGSDEWTHPLVRFQRLNLEQSLLIAILRKHFLKHEMDAGIGSSKAIAHLDDLLADVQIYLGDLGSEKREQTRLRNLLEKLKAHGIVSKLNDNDQVTIRPIIAHLANPENLTNLLAVYQQQAKNQ